MGRLTRFGRAMRFEHDETTKARERTDDARRIGVHVRSERRHVAALVRGDHALRQHAGRGIRRAEGRAVERETQPRAVDVFCEALEVGRIRAQRSGTLRAASVMLARLAARERSCRVGKGTQASGSGPAGGAVPISSGAPRATAISNPASPARPNASPPPAPPRSARGRPPASLVARRTRRRCAGNARDRTRRRRPRARSRTDRAIRAASARRSRRACEVALEQATFMTARRSSSPPPAPLRPRLASRLPQQR